ncbi:MAG: GAF domain-containing protein, partial [Deltaproteobacteria bacterium]|nr:GAF domain-containing protein [Deltaproteobacteria bacterium]
MVAGPRLLVIEDDERQAAALEQLCREQLGGFEIEVAHSGGEALARLGSGDFDAVVLDDTLPDMRAVQLLERMPRRERSLPPVIVLSGLTDLDAASEVLRHGVRGFVPKSLDLGRTLPILLRRALDEHAPGRVDPLEDHYRTLLEEAYEGIYILQDSHFVYVNRRFEQLFGCTRAQAIAPDFDYERLIAPQSREMIRDRARRSARGETLDPRYEFVACNAEGDTFDVGVSVAYIEHEGRPATLGVIQDITERKAFEKALVRRNRELAVLNDIAATVNRSLDLGTVLDIAAERVISVMNLSAAGISLLNHRRNVVENHTFRGVTDDFRRHVRAIPFGVGIVGIVAQTGELLVIDDLRTDPRVHMNELRGTGFVSAVAVPIKAAGRMLGVAVGFSDHGRSFSAEELDLLTHIGNQIGTAIDKAQIYERLKTSVRRMVALDEITRVISGTLDAREVFALAASQLHRLVGCERVSVALYESANDSFELHFLSVDGV